MARLPNDQDSSSSSSPSLSDETIEQSDIGDGGGDGGSGGGGGGEYGDIQIPEDELPSDRRSESEGATQESGSGAETGGVPADINQGRRATDPPSSASSTSSGSSSGGSSSGGQDTAADIASPEPNAPADINQGRRATDPPSNSNEQTTSSTGSESQAATADAEIVNDSDQQNTATVADPQGGRRDIQEESLEQRAADQAGQAVSADEVNVEVDDEGVSDVTVREAVPDVADQQGGRRDIQEESLEAAVSEQAGNAVSSDEVDVSLSDEGLEDVRVNETTPNVADQQGGQREIQEGSLEQAAADSLEGVDASGVDAEVSDTGADISLNRGGARDLREAQTSLSPNERAKFEGAETATMAEDPVVDPVDRSGNKKSNTQQVTEAFSIASAADRLAGKTDEAVGRTIEGFQNVADARGELNAGERFTAYARITTRNTFGRGAEDLAFQGDFAGNQDDIDLFGRSVNSSLGGNGSLIVGNGQGEEFTAVTNSLTKGKGLFSDETIRDVKRRLVKNQERFGVGEELAGVAEDLGAGSEVQNVAAGIGELPGEAASFPQAATIAADTGTEALVNAPRTVNEYGATQTGGAVLNQGGKVVKSATDNPYRTLGNLVGEVALGTAAVKSVEAGVSGYRSGKIKRKADTTEDLEDLTPKPEQNDDLPNFETGTGASDAEAVAEIKRRAADQPDSLQDAFAERIISRSDNPPLDDDFEAGEGNFEAAGLFGSPDVSTLRLEHKPGYVDTGRLGRLKMKAKQAVQEGVSFQLTPDLSEPNDGISMFTGDRVEAMPSYADETGYVVRDADGEVVTRTKSQSEANKIADAVDGEKAPDPELRTNQFLNEEAEEGVWYVRTRGDRTTELEVVTPPGTEFERSGTAAVRLPDGRIVEDSLFRQADEVDADAPDGGRVAKQDTDAPTPDDSGGGIGLPNLRTDDRAQLSFGRNRGTNKSADADARTQLGDGDTTEVARGTQDLDAEGPARLNRRTSRREFTDTREVRVAPTVVPGVDTDTTTSGTTNRSPSSSFGDESSLPETSGSAPGSSPLSGSTSSLQSSAGSESGVTDVPGFPTSTGGTSGGSVGGGSGGFVGGGSGGSIGGTSGGSIGGTSGGSIGGGSGGSIGGTSGGSVGSSGGSYGFGYSAGAASSGSSGIVPTPDSSVDDKERFSAVAGADASKLTDFVDPLSGRVLETRDPRRRPDSPL